LFRGIFEARKLYDLSFKIIGTEHNNMGRREPDRDVLKKKVGVGQSGECFVLFSSQFSLKPED
jgi:hypothetical protein